MKSAVDSLLKDAVNKGDVPGVVAVATDAKAGLLAESVEQQKLIGSPNQLEAILANLQKRAANYKDPTSP